MPAVLTTLTERKDLLSNEIYLLSAVTALQRVSETLPRFISPYLLDILLQVSTTSSASQLNRHTGHMNLGRKDMLSPAEKKHFFSVWVNNNTLQYDRYIIKLDIRVNTL